MGKSGGRGGVLSQPAWLSGICPSKARVRMLTNTRPCQGRSCANDDLVICFIRAISQDAVLCSHKYSVPHLALWPTSIMGSGQSPSWNFYQPSHSFSGTFSLYSCPQRVTLTHSIARVLDVRGANGVEPRHSIGWACDELRRSDQISVVWQGACGLGECYWFHQVACRPAGNLVTDSRVEDGTCLPNAVISQPCSTPPRALG
jgi:hypothetical protein